MSQTAPTNPDRETETIAGPELPDRLLVKLRVTIPGYELLDQIAIGGQATVYRARELTSGLTVAIKVLHGGPNADADSRERLGRETAALKALNHPNIVCVIESGRTPMGLDYLVMNFVDGRPLDALWRDAEFSASIAPEPPARLRLFKRICDIVQAAHLKGITHRDLSPSNILITAEGEPHVLDFGLASTAFNNLLTPEGRRVSLTGQFLGKVQYAAPEQARGGRDPVNIRTDVYALGVILYQILTNGVFPYEVVGNLIDVLNNIVHTRPLPPSSVLGAHKPSVADTRSTRAGVALVNETIEAVVLKALEKEPSARYQSAGELAADIDQYLAGRPTAAVVRRTDSRPSVLRHQRRRRTIVVASLVLIILIAGVLIGYRASVHRPSPIVGNPLAALPAKPLAIQLAARDATLHGQEIAYNGEPGHEAIESWKSKDAYLTWPIDAPKTGDYLVEVTYACSVNKYGSDVEFGIDTKESGTELLSFQVKDTGGWKFFRPEVVGKLRLPAGQAVLSLKVKSMRKDLVMSVRQVVLTPAQ